MVSVIAIKSGEIVTEFVMKVQRRRRPRNKYGNLLGLGLRYALNKARSTTKTKTQSSSGEAGVTNQYDTRLIYKKKRMNRRVLRRRTRYRKRFIRNATSLMGCQQFIFSTQTEPSSGLNTQTHSSFVFACSTGVAPSNDLATIVNNIQTSGVAAQFRKNETLYIHRSVCDITMYNQSATTADIDVYFIRCRIGHSVGTSVQGDWSSFLSQQKPDASLITNVATSTIGCTPWQAPQWCRHWTIFRKRKYLLTQGQTAHFQIKRGYRTINTEINTDYFFQKGETGVLLVWNGVNVSTAGGFPDTKLSITYVRTYNVKYSSEGDDRVVTI